MCALEEIMPMTRAFKGLAVLTAALTILILSGCGSSTSSPSLPSGKYSTPYILSYKSWCGVDRASIGKGTLLRLTFAELTDDTETLTALEKVKKVADAKVTIDAVSISADGTFSEKSMDQSYSKGKTFSSNPLVFEKDDPILAANEFSSGENESLLLSTSTLPNSISRIRVTLDNSVPHDWATANPIFAAYPSAKPTIRLMLVEAGDPLPPPPKTDPPTKVEPPPNKVDIIAYPCYQISPELE